MFNKLMQDAAPKAFAVSQTTKNITNKLSNNVVVTAAKNIGYKAAVNTLGVGLVLATPMANKAKGLLSKGWAKVSALAAEQKSTETK